MPRNKMTTRQRIVAVESLKGKNPVQALERGNYSRPYKHYTEVGQAIASKPNNPITFAQDRKNRQAMSIINYWQKLVDHGNNIDLENVKVSDMLRASELMAKYLGLLSSDGSQHHTTNNTLVLGDIRDMSEQQIMEKLSMLRSQSIEQPIEHTIGDVSSQQGADVETE